METGFIIKRLRTSEALSQSELADALGVTRAYLSQVENARKQAGLDLLRKVAERFQIPVSLLVAWEERGKQEDDVYVELQRLFADLLAAKIASSSNNCRVRLGAEKENEAPESIEPSDA